MQIKYAKCPLNFNKELCLRDTTLDVTNISELCNGSFQHILPTACSLLRLLVIKVKFICIFFVLVFFF